MAFSAVTDRGATSEKVSDTSLGGSPSAALTVSKVVFAVLAFDNIATADGASTTNDTLTDTDGHTWTKVAERTNSAGVANDGVTGALWWTKVTTEIGTGDTVTFNVDSATTAKIISLFEVTVGAGQTIQLAGSTFVESDASNVPALTLAGLPSKEYLFLGIWWRETDAIIWAEDVDYTNLYAAEGVGTTGGAPATNVSINVGYRIATLTGDEFDVSGLTAVQNVGALLAFEEVAEGGGSQSLTGSLFVKTPIFFTGAITATRALTGVLFTKAPTFPTGTVAAAYALTGTLFQKAPTFPQGAITTGAVSLTGVLFQNTPTFPTGTVTTTVTLTGSLFVKAPTFFTGTIGQAGTLFGTLYVNTPIFFTGTMGQLGGSFWRPNPVAYTLAPVGYTPIGPNDIPPWAIDIQGVLFVKAPTFPVGTVS